MKEKEQIKLLKQIIKEQQKTIIGIFRDTNEMVKDIR